MGKIYTDQELTQLFGQKAAESKIINKKMQETYDVIRKKEKKTTKQSTRKVCAAFGGVAAVLVLAIFVFSVNPVLAAKIPIIGRIFQITEEKVSYPGDYSNSADPFITAEQNTAAEENGLYSQTSSGYRFTISECYADSMSMYLAVIIAADNGFPQEMIDAAKNTDLAYQTLEMDTTAVADFTEAGLGNVQFDPAYGTESPYIIEGNFIDNETFAGIIRIDLTNLTARQEDGSLTNISSVPGNFIYELTIRTIYANENMEGSENNQPNKISGIWAFSLNIIVDDSKMVIKNVNQTNDDGIGIGEVKKSPYEIEAELVIPADLHPTDYVIIMADANSEPLRSRGGTVETYDIYKREVGKVIIGICDETTFMKYKGNFEELLSKTIFRTEVLFTE